MAGNGLSSSMPGSGLSRSVGGEEQRRSLIISALVKQVKDGSMSKRELFNELSTLQQQRRSVASAASTEATSLHSTNRRTQQRTETTTVSESQLQREYGRFESTESGSVGAARHTHSDSASLTSTSTPAVTEPAPTSVASSEAPAPAGPVSGFSNPDRRAFIQRLLEEKRKARDAATEQEEVRRFREEVSQERGEERVGAWGGKGSGAGRGLSLRVVLLL